MHVFWLVLIYDLSEDRRTDDVIVHFDWFLFMIYQRTDTRMTSSCILIGSYLWSIRGQTHGWRHHAFWLVLIYDLSEDRHTDDVIMHFDWFLFMIYQKTDARMTSSCILIGSYLWSIRGQTHGWRHHAFWLVLIYDLSEDRRTDDVIVHFDWFLFMIYQRTDARMTSSCILIGSYLWSIRGQTHGWRHHAFWLVLIYDLSEDRHTDDVIMHFDWFLFMIYQRTDTRMTSSCILIGSYLWSIRGQTHGWRHHTFWLVLIYDLSEDRRTDDVIMHFDWFLFMIYQRTDARMTSSCILIGSYLWSIRGQTHGWRHRLKHFPSVFF